MHPVPVEVARNTRSVVGDDKLMSSLKNMPWITKEGYLDITKLPIDNVLKRALQNDEEFRGALSVLEAMHTGGRKEAGIFLLGLLISCDDNWEKRTMIVESLGREVMVRPSIIVSR